MIGLEVSIFVFKLCYAYALLNCLIVWKFFFEFLNLLEICFWGLFFFLFVLVWYKINFDIMF